MRVDEGGNRGWRAMAVAVVIIGGLVGLVLFLNRPDWTPRSIVAVSGATTENQLEVTVAHNRCGSTRVRADETGPATIELRAEQDIRGDCEDIGLETTFTVELTAPLAERRIVIEQVPGGERGPIQCSIAGSSEPPCAEG